MPRFRRSRPRCVHVRPEVQLQRLAKGEGGERALQDWLDRSRLAYLYLDQTPLTIPAAHRADIKRPDFLVAVDGLGTVAVDAKAKSFTDGCFVLNASERRRLDGFESIFCIPVWYACFPSEDPNSCHLFRNRDLAGSAVNHMADHHIIRVPLALAITVQHHQVPFTQALVAATMPSSRASQL